jgi:hypothetical protein
MGFSIGDHVQVIATDHPHYGQVGIIIEGMEVFYASGPVLYWLVDLGTDTISCTANQLSWEIPTDWQIGLANQQPAKTFQDLDNFIIRECRQLDRELRHTGGYDYEFIALPPVTHAIDGDE